LVLVKPSCKSDGVGGGDPADIGIIVAVGVVMQAGFAVQVLALKTDVLAGDGTGFMCFLNGVAKDPVAGVPDDLAVAVGEFFGCAVQVIVEVKDARW